MTSTRVLRNTYGHILDKDEDFGTVKPARYQLPGPEYTYGKPPSSDKEGAKEVVSSWKRHDATAVASPKKNFRALNKMSVNHGLTTAQHFRTFTKLNSDVTVTPKVGTKIVKLVLPDENFAFGVPNRPSTPMSAVVSNEYGNNAASETKDIYRQRILETYEETKTRPKTTKAVRLGIQSTAKKLEELNDFGSTGSLFKMKKFQSPSAKVDTVNRNYVPPNRQRPQTAMSTSSQQRPSSSKGGVIVESMANRGKVDTINRNYAPQNGQGLQSSKGGVIVESMANRGKADTINRNYGPQNGQGLQSNKGGVLVESMANRGKADTINRNYGPQNGQRPQTASSISSQQRPQPSKGGVVVESMANRGKADTINRNYGPQNEQGLQSSKGGVIVESIANRGKADTINRNYGPQNEQGPQFSKGGVIAQSMANRGKNVFIKE